MNYTIRMALYFIVTSFLFASCETEAETFEDGGLIENREANILNTWELESYFRNGVDETSLIFISNYEESYLVDGIYNRTYIDEDNELVDDTGSWGFDTEEIMHIDGVSSINEFSQVNSTLSSSRHNILRLTENELWYWYENGGDEHEFHFRSSN